MKQTKKPMLKFAISLIVILALIMSVTVCLTACGETDAPSDGTETPTPDIPVDPDTPVNPLPTTEEIGQILAKFEWSAEGNQITILGLKQEYLDNAQVDIPIVPECTIRIDDFAFAGKTGLSNISISNSVTYIGHYAFQDCTGIVDLTLPNSITDIGSNAFHGCENITSVSIPASAIGYIPGANLSKVNITGGSTVVERAFQGCTKLREISIAESVTSIGNNAFLDCENIEKITVPAFAISHIPNKKLKEAVIISGSEIESFAFKNCESLTTVTLPEGITTIGAWAFNRCTALVNITIPNSVTQIGNYAFESCKSLSAIALPNGVSVIGDGAFGNCTEITAFNVPASVSELGHYTFDSCSKLESLSVAPENTKYHSAGNCIIETGTHMLVVGCKTSKIPDNGSVTDIGQGAFQGCAQLKEIVIPNRITSIGRGAFSSCVGLETVTIPNSVTSIGTNAFYKCQKIKNISMPATAISYIPKNSLASVAITSGQNIPENAFAHCENLATVTLHGGITSIGNYAFENCGKLETIKFKNTVAEWRKMMSRVENWNKDTPEFNIECTDGVLDKSGNPKA